jgi:hypothetical protein
LHADVALAGGEAVEGPPDEEDIEVARHQTGGVMAECEHCGDETSDPVDFYGGGGPFKAWWCRDCYRNYDGPSEPASGETIAKFRQDHYGEGVSYRELKGR